MTTHQPELALEPTGSVVVHTAVIETPLEPLAAAARAAVMTKQMGALVVFDGIVRNHDHGQAVAELSYTAHPQAGDYMAQVLHSVADEVDGVRLWAVHRVGSVPMGESALTVMVAAAHRAQAFVACQIAAERIKAEVPLWKEQKLTDGTVEWVGLETAGNDC